MSYKPDPTIDAIRDAITEAVFFAGSGHKSQEQQRDKTQASDAARLARGLIIAARKSHPAIVTAAWAHDVFKAMDSLLGFLAAGDEEGIHNYRVVLEGYGNVLYRSVALGIVEPEKADAVEESEDSEFRRALAVATPTAARILRIGEDPDMDADRKMQEVCTLDKAWAGKNSREWATLLKITAARVRQLDFWKKLQAAKRDSD